MTLADAFWQVLADNFEKRKLVAPGKVRAAASLNERWKSGGPSSLRSLKDGGIHANITTRNGMSRFHRGKTSVGANKDARISSVVQRANE